MSYSDPFRNQQSSPLSRTLRKIVLQGNMQLNWPEGYAGVDYIASINLIESLAPNFSVALPPADGANEGTAALFINHGALRIVINDSSGTQLTDLQPGESKYILCVDNTTVTGVWRVTGFGATTSTANAAALAGGGLVALGGRLAAAYPVSTTSSNLTVREEDRAKVFVFNAGSATVTLPSYDIVSNFFIGIKNSGSGTVSIVAPAGTVDGFATFSLAPNESIFVYGSGTPSWYTIGFGRSTEFQFTKLVKDVSAGGTIELSSSEVSNKLLQFIGSPTTDVQIILPSVVGIYFVQNTYASTNSLTIKTASGSGVALDSSSRAILYCDGVNVVAAQSVAVGTNLSVIDGSLNAPSISFAADVNTGLYRADVDTLGIASDGVDAARFHRTVSSINGRLGIGTTAPASQLHVNSGANEAIRVQGTGALSSYWNTGGTARFGYRSQGLNTKNGITYNKISESIEGEGEYAVSINGVERFTVTKTGIIVNGTVESGNAVIPYATLEANTFTGVQQLPAERLKFVSFGSLPAGTKNIDLALAGTFSCSFTGIVNFTFTNKPPAGYDQTVYLKTINGAAFPPVWPVGTRHPRGVKPVLSSGIDLLAIWYDAELQCHVVGLVWPDYK